MNECLILVDNSNVFIEGKRFAAKQRGLESEFDGTWRIDFGALLKEVANGHKIIKAMLVGSTPPPNDSVWGKARSDGFEVVTFERSFFGDEKSVDTEIVAVGMEALYEHTEPAILKLLSGDRDFMPLIKRAFNKGWENEIWAFNDSLSNEISMAAHRVKLLDSVFDKIGHFDT
jgi:uncharacterized LabA/DUF88 family protein